MENSTDKLIQDQLATLPPDVREAVARVPWETRVNDIAKREGLSEEQAENLKTETMLVLYGFAPFDSYQANVVTQVGIGDEQAERVAKLVTDEIFSDIEKQFEMIDALAPKATSSAPKKEEMKAPVAEDKGLLNIPPEIMAKSIKMPSEPIDKVPALAPENLPEVVPGQAAHDVPHVEAPASVTTSTSPTPAMRPTTEKTTPSSEVPVATPAAPTTPKSIVEEKLSQVTIASAPEIPAAPQITSYKSGQDPYREPLE